MPTGRMMSSAGAEKGMGSYEGGALVLATCAFAIQIYCDFGGYSDNFLAAPRRLPPRGMYTYSRNQLVREMCHRFQNSVTEQAK